MREKLHRQFFKAHNLRAARIRARKRHRRFSREMSLLVEGKLGDAIAELSQAVALEGEEYAIYRLGLARAYLAANRLPEALAAAKQSAGPLDPVEPQLNSILTACVPF